MNGTVSDTVGIVLGAALAVPVVVLPGYALGAASGILGFRDAMPGRQALAAVLIGLALLPWIDSMLVRVAGVPVAAAVNLVLAVPGLACAMRGRRAWRVDGIVVAVGTLWLALVVYAMADLDLDGALYQPLLVIDLVKHAATTRAIVETGAPPQDPFFARDVRVSYYYFFYTLAALVDWLGAGWVDGRTAFAGLAVWTGIGLVGLLDQLLVRSGLVLTLPPHRVRTILLMLLPVSGLDILLVLKARLVGGSWVAAPEWVNEQVAWWPTSLVWVPHHVAGILAAWLGWLALTGVTERGDHPPPASAILVAGVAFASCIGLSVWVCLGAVVTTALWLAILAVERRWRDAAYILAAGLLGFGLGALPLRDVLANRSETGAAVALAIRRFSPVEGLMPEPWMSAVRLVLLPVNYYVEFGVFASGALLLWRLVPRAEIHASESGRLLTLSAVATLTLGGVLRSVVINNDLGWRVVLFGQVSAIVWTVAAVSRLGAARNAGLPRTLAALWLLGCVTTLYGLVELRDYPISGDPAVSFVNARPEVDHALRDAYAWAGANLPADLVLQHDPAPPRVFAFGLYGRQPVGVADAGAKLFGASGEAVTRRIALLDPVFAATLDDADLRRRVGEAGVGALVVSAQDPVWQDRASWVWRAKAAYVSPFVRIIRAGDL